MMIEFITIAYLAADGGSYFVCVMTEAPLRPLVVASIERFALMPADGPRQGPRRHLTMFDEFNAQEAVEKFQLIPWRCFERRPLNLPVST